MGGGRGGGCRGRRRGAEGAHGGAVCLYGTATIDEDLNRRRSAWVPGLARFVPGGPEDPEFVLVSIDPDRVEVWSEQDRVAPDPFGMASAVVLRSADSWAGPTTTHPGM